MIVNRGRYRGQRRLRPASGGEATPVEGEGGEEGVQEAHEGGADPNPAMTRRGGVVRDLLWCGEPELGRLWLLRRLPWRRGSAPARRSESGMRRRGKGGARRGGGAAD